MRGILTYHSIDESGSVISIDRDTFRRQLDWIAASNARVNALDELLHAPAGQSAVALTFDDAYENFATVAWPLLRERGFAVTLFVPTGHVGGSNTWDATGPHIPARPLLDWAALRRLSDEGVELAAHGVTHRNLTRLDDDALAHEITEPARRLHEETGREPRGFAYPYGHHNDRAARAVRKQYAYACTTELRTLRAIEDAHRLPRVDMWYVQRPGAHGHWGSRSFRRYLMLRNRLRSARRLIDKGAAL